MLISDPLDRRPHSGPETPSEIRETHSANVVLIGDRAYKIKKPVDLGFLDFRTEAARAQACHTELELNRRLAADVYLDVVTINASDGTVVDHMLVMRRMPDDRRLSHLVRSGHDGDELLRALARTMAAFHAGAKRSAAITAEAGAAGLARRWRDNLRETEAFRGTAILAEIHDRIGDLAREYIAGRRPLFEERADAGLYVDGHGDLIADDIFCLPDHPRVLDCIEFDDRLRYVDVADDVAFLAMDLEHLGHPELGARFLADYAEFSGVRTVASLMHHYLAYRAYVRAKVACIRSDQIGVSAQELIDQYTELALRHLEAGEVTLTLVGGAPGTGKSTVAERLADGTGAALLGSDIVRQEVAIGASQRYEDEAKSVVYHRLLDQARTALTRGESVVADATWGEPETRELAETVAREAHARLVVIECRVPIQIAAARAQQRLESGGSVSEAGADVARSLAARRRPWPSAVVLDTSGTIDSTMRELANVLAMPAPQRLLRPSLR